MSFPSPESLALPARRVNRKSRWPLWGGSAARFGRSAELLCSLGPPSRVSAMLMVIFGAGASYDSFLPHISRKDGCARLGRPERLPPLANQLLEGGHEHISEVGRIHSASHRLMTSSRLHLPGPTRSCDGFAPPVWRIFFRMRIFFDLWPPTTNFPLTSITVEVT